MQGIRPRLVNVYLTMGSDDEMAVASQRLFHGAYGARTTHQEGDHVPGENNNILEREKR